MDQVDLRLVAISLNAWNPDISHPAQIIVLTLKNYVYVYECFIYMYVSAIRVFNECRDQNRAMDPLELSYPVV